MQASILQFSKTPLVNAAIKYVVGAAEGVR